MVQDVQLRNNVKISGKGKRPLIFAAGFGCDQTVWRSVAPFFKSDYKVILFDYVGLGKSDLSAYNKEKYGQLSGYVQDILDVCEALDLKNAIFVGHSVSGMIGILASLEYPEYFSDLIMIGPSPCYLNDPPDYYGGFSKEDITGLLELMDKNYIEWADIFAAAVINDSTKPIFKKDLEDRFCSNDPMIARQFAEACFFADNRKDLQNVSVSSLLLQCSNDVIAPNTVAEYMHQYLPLNSLQYLDATGHFPHMTHPEEIVKAMNLYLKTNQTSIFEDSR